LLAIQQKRLLGLRPSFSAHVRWGEHGAPVRFPLEFVMTQTPARLVRPIRETGLAARSHTTLKKLSRSAMVCRNEIWRIVLMYSLCPRIARLLRLPGKATVLADESLASMQQPPHDNSFVSPAQWPYLAFQPCSATLLFWLSNFFRLLEPRPRCSSRPASPA
jgi:hypothetical protein